MSVALQTPGPPRREVTWGEGIVVAAFHSAGGLKVAVDHIHTVVGPYIGTRNTFAKLLRVEDPSVLAERDLFRAWLLLTALGEDAESWGISDGVVPNGHDPARLREELRACRDSNPKPSDLWLVVRRLVAQLGHLVFGARTPVQTTYADESEGTGAVIIELPLSPLARIQAGEWPEHDVPDPAPRAQGRRHLQVVS